MKTDKRSLLIVGKPVYGKSGQWMSCASEILFGWLPFRTVFLGRFIGVGSLEHRSPAVRSRNGALLTLGLEAKRNA